MSGDDSWEVFSDFEDESLTMASSTLSKYFIPKDYKAIGDPLQHSTNPINTLPDLLRPGLDLVFVGINPGSYSAAKGHYYARPGNLFWWALSESGLVEGPATPDMDASLL